MAITCATSPPAVSQEAIHQVEVLPSHFSRIWTVSPTSRAKPWVTEPRKLQITVEEKWRGRNLWKHIDKKKLFWSFLNFRTATTYFHHWLILQYFFRSSKKKKTTTNNSIAISFSSIAHKPHEYWSSGLIHSTVTVCMCLQRDVSIRAWLNTSTVLAVPGSVDAALKLIFPMTAPVHPENNRLHSLF